MSMQLWNGQPITPSQSRALAGRTGGGGGPVINIGGAVTDNILSRVISEIRNTSNTVPLSDAYLAEHPQWKKRKNGLEDPTPEVGTNAEQPPSDSGGFYPLGRVGRKSCSCDKHYRIRVDATAVRERMYMVNGPGQGDDYYHRDGRHIVGESLSISAMIFPTLGDGVIAIPDQYIRFMVVCQKSATASALLGNDGIRYLTEAGTDYATACLADMAINVVGSQYVILYDDWVKVATKSITDGFTPRVPEHPLISISIDLKDLVIRMNGSGGNANCTNAIYFGFVTSHVNVGEIKMYSDFYFRG